MNMAIVESYYGDSHKKWIDDLQKNLTNPIQLFTLPPHHWKVRMEAGAIELAKQVNSLGRDYDRFLVSDMVNLPLFKSLLDRKYSGAKFLLYFHENQFEYPKSKVGNFDYHYPYINYVSALCADKVAFSSQYNFDSFFQGVKRFQKKLPMAFRSQDFEEIKIKSRIVPLIFEDPLYNKSPKDYSRKILLWNHRWEYDKGIDEFYQLLEHLKKDSVDFQLVLLGEAKNSPYIEKIKNNFNSRILHMGYTPKHKYSDWVSRCTHLPVTSQHDFFGLSVLEAIAQKVIPLLPNKMVYPEHIPNQLKNIYLYHDREELIEKLKTNSSDGELNIEKLVASIGKYQWSNLSNLYLDFLS